jgi:hypothetical protein
MVILKAVDSLDPIEWSAPLGASRLASIREAALVP